MSDEVFLLSALRLLDDWTQASTAPELHPGRLPRGLGLTFPGDCRIVGSLVSGPESTVLVAISQIPASAIQLLRDHFRDLGWWVSGQEEQPSGTVTATLRHDSRGTVGTLYGYAFSDGGSLVETALRSIPAGRRRSSARDTRKVTILGEEANEWRGDGLSRLRPPSEADQFEGEGGGTSDHSYRTFELRTELPLDAIAFHYARQLKRLGWSLVEMGDCGPMAWSFWSSLPGQRRAHWFGVHLPDTPDRYVIHIEARPQLPSPPHP